MGIRSIAALLGIVLCAALALTDEQAAQGSFPGRNGLIVFQSDRRFGGIEPWLISADGRGIKRLKGGGRVPAWSPDGRRIVSFVELPGGEQLTVLNIATRRLRRLPRRRTFNAVPTWSPDGSQILFSAANAGHNADLYVTNSDGSQPRRLTRTGGICEDDAAWSPDGASIAFDDTCRDSPFPLYVMNADGSSRRQIATGSHPSWSPDGTQLAFEAGYPEHVDVINIDGSGRRTVTTGGQPAWSPDGRELAVVRPVQGLCEPWNYMTRIFAVTLDGRTERMITPLGSSTWCDPEDSEPDWQPRCTQYGHGGRDHLRGMPSDDVICALAGRDSVRAEAGDDVVIGGSGNDVIEGGPGKDRLFGAAGDDIIRARDGEPDIVNGGPGRDRAQIDARLDRVSSVEELLP